ncbi:PDZ domain-containing protein [Bacillus tianshenii]|uniref:S16 family serine protease n=1 Tax=Sutcliffiella tianshenii TaxID=1463404 RepID=UPI001CD4BE61|nr:S16 family serine protease [Bacillus tianshenii]MCA1320386.1 PDZ domain-containing protein [Bacillus tianshenii]
MRDKKIALGIILASLLLVGSALVPTGYDVLFADEPIMLDELVEYEDGYELDGEIGMTYVSSLENVGWPYLVLGMLFEEGVDIEPAATEELDIDVEDLHYQYEMMMIQSKIKAEYKAREYMDDSPDLTLTGFYPAYFEPDWKYKNMIKVTDILVAMDGVELESYEQLDQLILEKEPDEKAVLSVMRDGERKDIEVRTYPERDYYNNTFLGMYVEEVFELVEDERINFNIEEIGGPSAGLMLTLTLIEKMTEESLLKGNKVAGTGTIEMDGFVGPIGGVKQKVIGADLAGYEYFLVPEDNDYGNNEEIARQTVKEEGLSIKLIPIGSLEEAVAELKKLPENK